jgi:GNAT superfamily N-acetyltransferase
MQLTIDHLFNHSDYLPLVAKWIYNEFWTDRPGFSPETFEKLLQDASSPDRIPLSLLAIADGIPAGTINLIDSDDAKRSHLHPWFAALLVIPQFRGRGIARELIRKIKMDAQRLGFTEAYFGTDIPAFYLKLGAEHFEQENETHFVMRFLMKK